MASVFVVEDAALQQNIIGRFLQSEHTVLGTESDGNRAVERIEALEPDVVIMDINLPGLDGISAAEAVRSRCPETGIIVSTAIVNDEVREMADELSVGAYLVKPYSKPELLEAIDDAVS